MGDTQFIAQPRKDMGMVFNTPDKPSQICAFRIAMFQCTNPNIKMAAITLHGGGAIKNWVGVYGIKTPEKEEFINSFSVFTFDGIKTPGHVKKLHNFKYVSENDLKTPSKDENK